MTPRPGANLRHAPQGMFDLSYLSIVAWRLTQASYIFLGHEGDPERRRGPKWAKEGSFLVFRQLDQKVPEFEGHLKELAEKIPGNYGGNPEKLGAHMMGRWKSGAPLNLILSH